jgi:hypothetical protein
MQNVYGPLSKEYCFWFYLLSIVGFVMMVITIATSMYVGIVNKKGISFYLSMVAFSISYGIIYFQNRLLWSMCSKTL